MADKKDIQETGVQIQGSPDSLVPKYSTNTLFSISNNKMIISFLFTDNKDVAGVVVQRIVIDLDHAQRIAELIPKIIKKEEENE
jgi:hypothetical protein